MKKKFHIKALNMADSKTGKMSKIIASAETDINKMSATVLYPIN